MTAPTSNLAGLDVLVLAGGLGTRLKPVLGEDTPKILAPVRGRPFLDHLMAWLADAGARRLVLSLGHLAEAVVAHVGRLDTLPLAVDTVIEPAPLGTAGAIRYARQRLGSEPVLVMNGDTWLDADLGGFVAGHRQAAAALSLLCVEVPDASRFGRIHLAGDGTVARFAEKEPGSAVPGLISAGVYLFSQSALDRLGAMDGPSVERDYLARLPAGSLNAHVCRGAHFIDIGTPESFARAGSVIAPAAGARGN